MLKAKRLVFPGLFMTLMALALSCIHEPIPSCEGVVIKLELTKADASAGIPNGSITAAATGDSKFFTYSINDTDFQAGNKFSGLDSGKYTITVKNSWGCKTSSDIAINRLDPCAGITLTANIIPPAAGLSNGSITAVVSGGTGYTFALGAGPYQTGSVFGALAAGNYVLTAKNALCTLTIPVTLGVADACAGVLITVTSTTVNPTLAQSNGSITATATGTSGLLYSINSGAFQPTGIFNGLAAGTYTVTAKSTSGCTGTQQVVLTAGNPCAGVTVAVTATSVNPSATSSNGSITAVATGGTGFTYSLNGGTYQTSGMFSNLAAGNYVLSAKNADGCIGTTQVPLGASNPCATVTVAVTATITDATAGLSNGNIAAAATGGTGFTYSLNNGAYQATGTFPNLASGSYTIIAKNADGCLGSAQFTVGSVNNCASITITATSTTSNNCVTPGTGTITVTAAGSTGFTYNLNGGTYQTSAIFSGVSPGSYTMGIKDVNNCTNTATVAVVLAPAGPTFSAVKVLVQSRCSGSGCHTNGQTQKGYNFDTDCNIVKSWSGINGSCVTATLTKMPISPQPNLTTAEKQTITNWINAGHGFSN